MLLHRPEKLGEIYSLKVNSWSFWQNEAKFINFFNGALLSISWKSPVDFGEESCFLTQLGIPLSLARLFRYADGAMIEFELAEPTTLADAIRLLDPGDETIRPVAGGTALMLMMKAGVFRPAKLVSLRKIESNYTAIAADARGLTIGAMTTLSDIEQSEDIRAHAPLITQTLLTLSNVRVRNVATVGGALAHGDPHMDLPPVLMALDASLTVAGPNGVRSLPVADLFTGYYETVLALNELIAFVHVPAQKSRQAAYLKVTTGAVDDWPALGIAVAIVSDADVVRSARIIASAATDKATRLTSAESVLTANRIDDKLLRRVAEAAVEEVELVSDVRGSAPYKRELMRVYVQRAVRAALNESGGR